MKREQKQIKEARQDQMVMDVGPFLPSLRDPTDRGTTHFCLLIDHLTCLSWLQDFTPGIRLPVSLSFMSLLSGGDIEPAVLWSSLTKNSAGCKTKTCGGTGWKRQSVLGASLGLLSLFTIQVALGHFIKPTLSQAYGLYNELTQSNLPLIHSTPKSLAPRTLQMVQAYGIQMHHHLLPCLEHYLQGVLYLASLFSTLSHQLCDIYWMLVFST